MKSSLSQTDVIQNNRDLHRSEAPYYDWLHSEIWNVYEQNKVWQDIKRIRHLIAKPSLHVLDIGCGTGNLALKFFNKGDVVDAVDLSREMLDELRRKQPANSRLRLFEVDVDTFLLSTNNYYDVICFSSVLHHLPDYQATLMRCVDLLAQNGVLYITHEPLPKDVRQPAPLQDFLTKIGWIGWSLWQRILHRHFPQLNYSLSDVHVEAGIDPDNLLKQLSGVGLKPIFVRRYRAEKLAIIAAINNEMFGGHPQVFSFMAQKCYCDE